MAPEVADVERALLALAPHDRAAVIHSGLLSLDDGGDADQTEVDAAWRTEFRRRINDIDGGKVSLISGEESESRVRSLLTDLHK